MGVRMQNYGEEMQLHLRVDVDGEVLKHKRHRRIDLHVLQPQQSMSPQAVALTAPKNQCPRSTVCQVLYRVT
jgi:hypothetical protein